ncbi:DUF3885 domain-containing protein [Nevskia sp.]|uniref:DUF3885 domain-containing protein n=1 Tax=Nevskia sp. TaxID=1929292 RepID=UPI0025F8A93F|nr:DUF3885 domain-containing protein [Nevskia sp.]
MPLRDQIETLLCGRPERHALFHSFSGGLRFKLSEGETKIDQFLSALEKAGRICGDIFDTRHPPILWVRGWTRASGFEHRNSILEALHAGLRIPETREIWFEPVLDGNWDENCPNAHWLNIAFPLPMDRIRNALWCAVANGTGVKPQIGCDIYLTSPERGVVVHPYDDRGMDIVGPNVELLRRLYHRHHDHLLDCDRAVMRRSFGEPE